MRGEEAEAGVLQGRIQW